MHHPELTRTIDTMGRFPYNDKQGNKMVKGINKLEELNELIEQKILEIIGDPDYGLELRDEFKEEIIKRLKKKTKRISHDEVVKKFG